MIIINIISIIHTILCIRILQNRTFLRIIFLYMHWVGIVVKSLKFIAMNLLVMVWVGHIVISTQYYFDKFYK